MKEEKGWSEIVGREGGEMEGGRGREDGWRKKEVRWSGMRRKRKEKELVVVRRRE